MMRVTRTELNQRTAWVLARVAAGERLTVTDRGRAVAEIAPLPVSPWEELLASGIVAPAAVRGALPFEPVDSEESTAAILDELRADQA